MQFFLESTGGGTGGGFGNILSTFGPILLMVAVIAGLYFFMIRPQKKQEKEQNNMRNSLEIGDEIVTIGGIIGQVVRIKGETITIATGKDRTTIRLLRSAVREVTVKINAPAPEADKSRAKEAVESAPVKKDESDKPAKKAKKAKKAAAPAEEAPVEEAPVVEEAPAVEEAPVVEEAPAVEEAPVEAPAEEKPQE